MLDNLFDTIITNATRKEQSSKCSDVYNKYSFNTELMASVHTKSLTRAAKHATMTDSLAVVADDS